MAKITGIVFIKVNGELQRSKEGAKLMLGGFERTAQVGHSVYGYSEKAVEGTVEFTIAHVAGTDLRGLSDTVDAEIEFHADTGDNYLISQAFSTKPAELTGGEGEVALEFKGNAAELA